MITISLCMIVKNEQDTLPRCLDSVQGLIDEIVIVDTGSTDRTVEIAKTYTDRVETFPWCDDFAAARNFSFSLARKEYCLWLDADDVFLPDDRENSGSSRNPFPLRPIWSCSLSHCARRRGPANVHLLPGTPGPQPRRVFMAGGGT